MRKPLIAAATSLVLLAAAAYAALAQDALTGVFAPFVVDVQQAVPVEVSVAVPVEGGETVTATVPMTVNVSLRVSVEGPDVVTVETMGETEPEVTVGEPEASAALPEGTRVDAYGFPYTAEAPKGLEVLQVQGHVNSVDYFEIVGEVKNTSSSPVDRVEVVITGYDSEGRMVGVEKTYLAVMPVEPERVSPFRAWFTENGLDVASYSVKVTQ